ncbi:MAG: hypothetical protein JRG91_01460 [Deltaproteobacteria bacterium]|nr:hypothetical protein [Deltaproteobacteria bacterium]
MRGKVAAAAAVLLALALAPAPAEAQESPDDGQVLLFGFKVSVGGRYDNVRMCVASPAGAKGGLALDVSFFAEIGIKQDVSVIVNVPLFRPIMFAAAFRMLQFEPDVTLAFRHDMGEKVDLIVGPTIGFIFHYGPDYTSERSGPGRTPSFFAMGPRIGAYLGFDFKRRDSKFNFQLGIQPYASPLFTAGDSQPSQGVILGGTLDGLFRFDAGM